MRTSRAVSFGLALTGTVGCLRPPLSGEASAGAQGSSEGEGASTSTTGGAISGESGGGPSSSDGAEAGTDAPSLCGDGVVEADEDCDDGNADPHDACSDACTSTGLWAATYDNPGPNGAFWTGVAFTADGRAVVAGYERLAELKDQPRGARPR